ncbi:OsmC family protein [Shewanella waksmanii]|uniref:OsmC family protein n=1 Tax=Shewanella waksmanii TaxID=213783 RepID=UPI003735E785
MLFSAKLTWTNSPNTFDISSNPNTVPSSQWSRQHNIVLGSGITIACSSAASFLGNDDKANPEEMLLAAVSSCHMLSFLAIAEKKRWLVEHYQDQASAILTVNENGKQMVSEVNLTPNITFNGTPPTEAQLDKAHQLAHQHCFIANSIKAKVNIISQ